MIAEEPFVPGDLAKNESEVQSGAANACAIIVLRASAALLGSDTNR